ncbi:hypothetical protein N9864_00865 [bacterium]|nr:hypothetical protein [bacterium]
MSPIKVKIELDEYCYNCDDGCCTNYGTTTTVNGKELHFQNQDIATILQQVLTELGYEAEIIETYNGLCMKCSPYTGFRN